MPRKLFTWKLKNREIRLGERTLIVAVLNVTPDSFSDGGHYEDPDRAFARAVELEEQGADIIDIGAESTRPGSARISAAEEIRRLIPVLKRLKDRLGIPISVDTYKAEVAELAIEHGAEIINDPSGFTWDPLIAKAVVQSDAGLILNHMRGTPETWAKLGPMPDVMLAIAKDLDASLSRARRAGVDRLKIVLDPGLGFGKRKEQNAEIIARLGDLAKLEYPVLIGPSRKSFLAQGTAQETLFATAAAVTASVLSGAHMVRVHDVVEMRAVLAVADEVLRAAPGPQEEEVPRRTSGYAMTGAPRSGPAEPKERLRLSPPRLIQTKLQQPAVEPVEVPELAEPDESPELGQDLEEPVAEAAPATEAAPVALPRAEEKAPREEKRFSPKPKSDPPRKDFKRADSRRPDSGPSRSGPSKSGFSKFSPPRSGPSKFGPPRSGPPKFRTDRPSSDRPPSGRPRSDHPPSDHPPSDRPERSGPPSKFGPSRSGPPRSGPPKFRTDRSATDRPERSGPPSKFGPARSGPPRSGPPSKFGGSSRSGPPRSGPPRSGPPRSGPPRSGPPRSGPPRSGPPRSGPPRSGPPRGR